MNGTEMKNVKKRTFLSMVKRNVKLFFKDKAMFFTSLITPLILLVLYGTFLWNVYEDSFLAGAEQSGVQVNLKLVKGCIGGELLSSLLAVSCITVAFCANMLMVQDKVNGADRDFKMTTVKSGVLAMSYYTATLISTLIISFTALGAGLAFIAFKGCLGRGSDCSGRDYFNGVRHGAFVARGVLFNVAGTDFGCGHHCQFGVRVYLRGVYADFAVPRVAAENDYVSAGNVRHFAAQKSLHGRGVPRNE